jgi:hypothetical protein
MQRITVYWREGARKTHEYLGVGRHGLNYSYFTSALLHFLFMIRTRGNRDRVQAAKVGTPKSPPRYSCRREIDRPREPPLGQPPKRSSWCWQLARRGRRCSLWLSRARTTQPLSARPGAWTARSRAVGSSTPIRPIEQQLPLQTGRGRPLPPPHYCSSERHQARTVVEASAVRASRPFLRLTRPDDGCALTVVPCHHQSTPFGRLPLAHGALPTTNTHRRDGIIITGN